MSASDKRPTSTHPTPNQPDVLPRDLLDDDAHRARSLLESFLRDAPDLQGAHDPREGPDRQEAVDADPRDEGPRRPDGSTRP
jgi:hypothetical protein